jgi:hypothetical protein
MGENIPMNRAFLAMPRSAAIVSVSFLLSAFCPLQAKQYYVSTTGADSDSGTALKPFQHIQKAADIMQPGDTALIMAGTYREWVKPARSGASETQRIVYRAASAGQVVITGSEKTTTWTKSSSIWKISIPNSMFGSYNPFKLNLSGNSLVIGANLHRGTVFLNDTSFYEKLTLTDVTNTINSWYVDLGDQAQTTLYANFGTANPNTENSEITVRECVFYPTIKGCKYITIENLVMKKSADNWVGMTDLEKGLCCTNWGYKWIIQNCVITDAKSVGLNCGNDKVTTSDISIGWDISTVGGHIVRNNLIQRCGENGIMGYKGWATSTIENNLIQDINYKKEFGGYETGALKIHVAQDVVIKNNIFRRAYAIGTDKDWAGLWLDWGQQGCRVTGNIVYDCDGAPFNFMLGHGPILIDNNIFVAKSRPFEFCAEGLAFVHNLFVNGGFYTRTMADGPVPYWTPHTATLVGQAYIGSQSNRWYNNIFIQKGTDQIPTTVSIHGNAPPIGVVSNYNVMFQGAQKLQGKDANSIVSSFSPNLTLTTLDTGVTIRFNANTDPVTVKCPLITNAYMGKFQPANMGIETHDAGPITVDRDMINDTRSATNPTAGPFERLLNGANTFTLVAGPVKNDGVSVHPRFEAGNRISTTMPDLITITKTGNGLVISMAMTLACLAEIISCKGNTVRSFSGKGTSRVKCTHDRLSPGVYLVRVRAGNIKQSKLISVY